MRIEKPDAEGVERTAEGSPSACDSIAPRDDWFTSEVAVKPHSIKATFLHWTAAHGAMCLALRHPQMTGSSRQLILDVINEMERLFKAEGMPQDELKRIHVIESEETAKLHATLEDKGDSVNVSMQSYGYDRFRRKTS